MSITFQVTPEDDPAFLARVEQTLWGVLLSQRAIAQSLLFAQHFGHTEAAKALRELGAEE